MSESKIPTEPVVKLTSLYVYNVRELLQHELDRLNATDNVTGLSLHQQKLFNEIGIDPGFQYADIAFGLLNNGYFLCALSSAAYVENYDRETGEVCARKRLDDLVWEMNAFAVKNSVAAKSEDPIVRPISDTWKTTSPRLTVTQGMGDEMNSPLVIPFNLGTTLGWIHGVQNISDQYRDITLAVGLLCNNFVLVGSHQAPDHDSYDGSTGVIGAIADIESQLLKYRLFVFKDNQHNVELQKSVDVALTTFDAVPDPLIK